MERCRLADTEQRHGFTDWELNGAFLDKWVFEGAKHISTNAHIPTHTHTRTQGESDMSSTFQLISILFNCYVAVMG